MQPNSTKANVQASLQPASTQKYLASDKAKRMGSARPLTQKKDSIPGAHITPADLPVHATAPAGPKPPAQGPMSKIGAENMLQKAMV